MQGIYCIENMITGRKYYGSSKNVDKRLLQHKRALNASAHHNIQLQRSFDKYGIENFNFYLVEATHFIEKYDLLLREQLYLDDNACGYNMAPANGGDCISKHPNRDDICSKISGGVKRHFSLLSSDDRKAKYGRQGDKNGMFGRTHTDETKEKISKLHSGNSYGGRYLRTAEVRQKLSDSRKGKFFGSDNAFYGHSHTDKTKSILREKMSGDNSWIKSIDPIELPYTKLYMITYPSGDQKIVAGLKIIATEFEVSITNVHATIDRMKNGSVPSKRSKFYQHRIEEIAQ